MRKYLYLFIVLINFSSAYALEIQKGWNLVYVGNQNAQSLLDSNYQIQSIWGWTGSEWQAKFRKNPSDNTFGELTELETNKGYWFKTTGSATVSGTQGTISSYSDFGIEENSGWNLVGTPTQIDVISFFAENLPEGGTVWTWQNNTWNVYTKEDLGSINQFNDNYQTSFSDLRFIEADQGFWINLVDTGDISIDLAPSLESELRADTCQIFPSNIDEAFKNGDTITQEMAEEVSIINCGDGWGVNDIVNATGINAFKNIAHLRLASTQLEEIDISKLTNLVVFSHSNCNFGGGLKRIVFPEELLELIDLDLQCNQISEITLPNMPKIYGVALPNNHLNSIDVSHLKSLETIGLYNNQLTSLDLSGLDNLRYVLLDNNPDLECNADKIGISQELLDESYCGVVWD